MLEEQSTTLLVLSDMAQAAKAQKKTMAVRARAWTVGLGARQRWRPGGSCFGVEDTWKILHPITSAHACIALLPCATARACLLFACRR